MSITPVAGVPPVRSEPSGNPSVGSSQSLAVSKSNPAKAPVPVSGTLSKGEPSVAKKVPSTYELPQDVVEVHQDPEIKDQVIIQYLDQAKDVILQVPSQQELNLERGIAQDFEHSAKLRVSEGTAAAASEGEKLHGNKL